MSYLLDKRLPVMPSWRSYFDVIVVDAKKPSFFTEQAPLCRSIPMAKSPRGAGRTGQ